MAGQKVRTQCPSLIGLPLRTGSMGCLWTQLTRILGWASRALERVGVAMQTRGGCTRGKRRAGPAAGGVSRAQHTLRTVQGALGATWCPSWSSGRGLWMVLFNRAAGLHGHSQEVPGMRWGCPKRGAVAGRGADGAYGVEGSQAGTCPKRSL